MSARKPAASTSASSSATSSVPGTRKPSAKALQPQIKNAADAKELEDEAAARALARKPKAALTPAEKRAAKLRQEQAKEEAAAAKQLKEKKLQEMKAARRLSGGSQPDTGRKSIDGSIDGSSDPSGRQSAAGLHPDGGGHGSDPSQQQDDVEFIENADGTFTAVQRASASETQAAQDDADEAAAEAAALAEKKEEENYDIIFDGPKSPLILAAAAKQYHEILRLIQEVPIEYRVEFVNAYDDHGCSAIFFAIGPEHQECMQLLLDYGADPCHANNKKNAPLHIACAIQNKKACRILIEHGANIAQENWQYQKPHEMVTERDKVSSTQAYLNLIQEAWVEKIANKEVFGNVTRHQRSYYRSIYDIADSTGSKGPLGVLKYDVIDPLLISSPADFSSASSAPLHPEAKWIFAFFSGWDGDKNGVISFPEFLHKIVAALNEKERLKKKAKRRQLMLAKRKKKREAEAAKKQALEDARKNPGAAMAEAVAKLA